MRWRRKHSMTELLVIELERDIRLLKSGLQLGNHACRGQANVKDVVSWWVIDLSRKCRPYCTLLPALCSVFDEITLLRLIILIHSTGYLLGSGSCTQLGRCLSDVLMALAWRTSFDDSTPVHIDAERLNIMLALSLYHNDISSFFSLTCFTELITLTVYNHNGWVMLDFATGASKALGLFVMEVRKQAYK